ncbi:MAG: class I SAM-dependent methyltransferase [Actinobacteria bacterium]|nr:class I SAM-dependent methyltransferase [Actinomycetota bacterium]
MSTSISFKQYGGNAAENYERYFVPTIGMPFAAALLDAAGLRRGERVLDIACGTGVVTRLAAERAGADGAVAGLDINPAMLAVARSVPSSGAAIEWHEANAEALPIADGSFDVVLSSLGLQFVPDKESALRGMRRVLNPDGRLAIATVGPTPPLFAILEQALARYVKPGRCLRAIGVLAVRTAGARGAGERRRIPRRRGSVEDADTRPSRTRGVSLAIRPQHPVGSGRRRDRRRGPHRVGARRRCRVAVVPERRGLVHRHQRRPDDCAEVISRSLGHGFA